MIPAEQRDGGPGHHPEAAAASKIAASKIAATTKSQDHPQGTGVVYPKSFAEWDALIRERPYGRRWSA